MAYLDENSSLLNRATQGAYAPGSLKLIVSVSSICVNIQFENYRKRERPMVVTEGRFCAGNRAHGEEN